MKAWLVVLAACGASAPPAKPPPPPAPPDAPAEAGATTAVRREHKPFSLFIYGLEATGAVVPATAKTAQDLTDELRKVAREDGLITLGADRLELVDEKVLYDCTAMIGPCRKDMATRRHVDHILYGDVSGHHVHLVLYEATSDIAIEWTGDVTDDPVDLARVAKTAFDSLISRSP